MTTQLRQVTDGVLNSTTSVTSATAAFTSADVGRELVGTGITAGTTIAARVSATEVTLSVAATATANGVTLTVMSSPYVTVASIREAFPALAAIDKFPTATLADLIEEFETKAENYCRRAFTLRSATETRHRGTDPAGRVFLHWPELVEVTSLTVNDVAQVLTTNYTIDTTLSLVTMVSVTNQLLEVAYLYGPTETRAGIARACREYVRERALEGRNPVGRNVVAATFEGRTERYGSADWAAGKPTGLPVVDEELNAAKIDRFASMA